MKSNLTSAVIRLKALALLLLLPFCAYNQDDTLAVEEVPEKASLFDGYYTPLSSSEAEANYNRINTGGANVDYKSVRNPKEYNESLVADPDNMLSAPAIDTLNGIMKLVEELTGYEMVVVCLNSIGDNDPHVYATDLFNHWGVGKAGADNGLLVMVVNDIHKVSTITGRGTEGMITDAQTDEVHENEMIPYFKKSDYVTGVVRGVQAYADMLNGVPPEYYSYESDYQSSDSDPYEETAYSSTKWYESAWFMLYLKAMVFLVAAYIIFLLVAFLTRDLHKRYHTLKFFTLLIWPILMPVPFLIFYFLNKSLMEKWRNTERFSPNTGEFMFKLDEQADDKHLKKGQVSEEVLNSIDYDVWVTSHEEDADVLILKYKRWFSRYRKCPKCKFKTYNKDYDRVISSATYTSSGTGEKKYSCKNCNHTVIRRYTIPRKVKSSSSGSSGGYSSGGGYSGGSSGGSSFGGGSSRGGGSTSGW